MYNKSKIKKMPDNASQHVTAGPYSPVLEIDCKKLVVISGQAAIDQEGNVIGDTVEEQTEYTLQKCLEQLQNANCSFDDVFKVNVYMTDLDEWSKFNEVYAKYFPDPKPARTTVGTKLLPGFLIEIELLAAKS